MVTVDRKTNANLVPIFIKNTGWIYKCMANQGQP